MLIKYDKLFQMMQKRGLTTYKIRKENIISQSALTAIKNGKSVTTDTIAKLCKVLDCQPGDLMENVDEEEANTRTSSNTRQKKPFMQQWQKMRQCLS